MLPVGTYYTDANYGLVVDYLIDAVPDELIPLTLYACRQIDSDFEILKEAPADFTETHGFAGWPPIHELPEEPPLE